MVELVDTLGLEPSAERRGGSTPSIPTNFYIYCIHERGWYIWKKGSIAKYDLSENKPIWVGIIEAGYSPYSICQYKNFVLVFSYTKWGTKPMIHCFDGSLYFLASSKEVAKLDLQSGVLIYRKKFKKSIFSSYGMIITGDQIYLLSTKDAKVLDKETGQVNDCPEILDKINLKEITSSLGNGTSFLSSISLTHPQGSGDGGAGMMAGGDTGGGGGGGE